MIDVSIDATMGVVHFMPDLYGPKPHLSSELQFSPARVATFIILAALKGDISQRWQLKVSLSLSITASRFPMDTMVRPTLAAEALFRPLTGCCPG